MGAHLFMGVTLAELRFCTAAEMNLAVSSAGVALAKYLKRRFGTPYAVGFPMGREHAERWLASLREGGIPKKNDENRPGKRLLIVADQVLGNSLRDALRLAGADFGIDVASFFGWDAELAESGDARLAEEAQYLRLLKTGRYFALAGDAMLMDVPGAERPKRPKRLEISHPAVSSELGWKKIPRYLSETFSKQIREFL